jgi:tRNA modification GTPase
LKREIVRHLGLEFEGYEQPIVSLRQFHELQTAICEGRSAAALLSGGSQQLVLAVGCLRGASEALGRIVGRVYSDDLLDAVFSRFCVGK